MSVRLVHRAARTTPSMSGVHEHTVERPPALPENNAGLGSLMTLVPLLGAGASMTVMMLFRGSSLAAVGALMMIATLLASVIMVVSQRGKATRQRVRKRDAYVSYLERTRAELRDQEQHIVSAARTADPHPTALPTIVRDGDRLWERRRADADFLMSRLGTGRVPVRTFVRTGEDDPMTESDRFMDAELDNLERRFSSLGELPVRLPLCAVGDVSVVGDEQFHERVSRLLVSQACVFSSPEDLHLAVAVDPQRRDRWDWITWLPHLADQRKTTPTGPLRRLAPDPGALERLLREDLRRRLSSAAENRRNYLAVDRAGAQAPMLVVLAADQQHQGRLRLGDREHGAAALGVTVLHLVDDPRLEPEDVRVRVSQDPQDSNHAIIEQYDRRDSLPTRSRVRLDEWSGAECEALARQLAGLRLSPDSLEHDAAAQATQITALLDAPDLERLDLDRMWRPRARPSFLRVPIGTDDHGEPVMLDLKEAAQFGMGPHGICVGATGSGKSELLRMLVLALLSSHSPEDLSMVLVDYKGGATFAPFADAPQVSGVITNLADDATLVERVHSSLSGEVQRRQQMLKDAGNLADITSYRRLRRERVAKGGEPMAPMPHLLVIIDEFGELLTARPDFIELFLSIGRIGRSIGVHLLLSSQRIEGGKLRGLDTYLSYRIGLRTLSDSESRTILDTPDAFSLPALPGYGYLKVDTTIYTRFRSGYVSGPLPGDEEEVQVAPTLEVVPRYPRPDREEVRGKGNRPDDGAQEDDDPNDDPNDDPDDEPLGPTVMSTVVDQLAQRPGIGQHVWLPPLPDQLTLDEAAGSPTATRSGVRIPTSGPLRVPLGRVDDPKRQTQRVWELDLAATTGHVLVVGAPRTGRTTFLRTVAASLAVSHSASDVVVYAIDMLGSNLQVLDDLPNVAGVGVRGDQEVVRRTVEEVHTVLLDREELFQQLRVDSLEQARAKVAGTGEQTMLADVVVLIDGYGPLNEELDALEDTIDTIVRRGAGVGIHVIVTVSRWNEARINQQTFFSNKIELRLTDPSDSAAGRKLSETLKDAPPGRALLSTGLFAQIALPRVDGEADRLTVAEGLADLVARVRSSAVDTAPRIRVLPPVVPHDQLAGSPAPGLVPLGLNEMTLATEMLDLNGADRHVVAIGESQTGRTSLLRQVIHSLVDQYTPQQIVFAVMDPRRTLKDEVPEEYLGAYAGSVGLAERLVGAVLPELAKRAESAGDIDSTGGKLPEPRIVVIADDYEILTAGGGSPLHALVPYIAMASEVNLNVLIARRTGGAARGVFEPAFSTIRDSGAVGLMFSGDRSEGQLLGTVRPQKLPTGRALLVRTGQPVRTVQVGFRDAADEALDGHGFAR